MSLGGERKMARGDGGGSVQVEGPTRLHDQLAAMVAFERRIALRIERVLDGGGIGHEAAASLLERIHRTSGERRAALAARLETIAPHARGGDPEASASSIEGLAPGDRRASGSLLAAHALLSQAVMEYAVLLVLAFRAADSIEHLGPENTGDLAWAHMRMCAALAQEIARAIPYVVVDELEEEGLDCRCACPTCGLGVCGCPLAFRRRLDLALAEAGPTEVWPGIRMVRPRPGSPAADAGVAKEDRLVRIDGEVLDSIPMLQEAIKAHASGETIVFEVQRVGGGSETIGIRRP